MKIAVIGSGIAGNVVAHHLHREHEITPETVVKRISSLRDSIWEADYVTVPKGPERPEPKIPTHELPALLEGLRREMAEAARRAGGRPDRCLLVGDSDTDRNTARAAGVPKATSLMYRDVYGWFERVERGVYELSPKGRDALATYADVVAGLATAEP